MKTLARKMPATICAKCGKLVRVKPSGGDWLNALYPVRHKNKEGARCHGSFYEVETRDLIEPKRLMGEQGK